MIGGALGGFEAMVFPHNGPGFWPMVSMGAVLAGTLEAPFTAVVFAIELTRDFNMALPLAMCCFVAYALMTLTIKRAILTEKIARRCFHLSREYAVDPMEAFLVKEAMRRHVSALPSTARLDEARDMLEKLPAKSRQHLYPILDSSQRLAGVITRKRLIRMLKLGEAQPELKLGDIIGPNPVTAQPDEPLRSVVYRMVETGLTRFPVVDSKHRLVGMDPGVLPRVHGQTVTHRGAARSGHPARDAVPRRFEPGTLLTIQITSPDLKSHTTQLVRVVRLAHDTLARLQDTAVDLGDSAGRPRRGLEPGEHVFPGHSHLPIHRSHHLGPGQRRRTLLRRSRSQSSGTAIQAVSTAVSPTREKSCSETMNVAELKRESRLAASHARVIASSVPPMQ